MKKKKNQILKSWFKYNLRSKRDLIAVAGFTTTTEVFKNALTIADWPYTYGFEPSLPSHSGLNSQKQKLTPLSTSA